MDNMEFMMVIGIIGGIILLFIIFNPYVPLETTELGTIESFTLSAGGFGHSDLCTVTLQDGNMLGLQGSSCSRLKTGKKITKYSRNGMIFYEVE